MGVPLLRVRFPDGIADDDFVVLMPYNPIPQGRLERAEDMDPCIFQGFLQNEKDSAVTLTGCSLSDNFQVRTKMLP